MSKKIWIPALLVVLLVLAFAIPLLFTDEIDHGAHPQWQHTFKQKPREPSPEMPYLGM